MPTITMTPVATPRIKNNCPDDILAVSFSLSALRRRRALLHVLFLQHRLVSFDDVRVSLVVVIDDHRSIAALELHARSSARLDADVEQELGPPVLHDRL